VTQSDSQPGAPMSARRLLISEDGRPQSSRSQVPPLMVADRVHRISKRRRHHRQRPVQPLAQLLGRDPLAPLGRLLLAQHPPHHHRVLVVRSRGAYPENAAHAESPVHCPDPPVTDGSAASGARSCHIGWRNRNRVLLHIVDVHGPGSGQSVELPPASTARRNQMPRISPQNWGMSPADELTGEIPLIHGVRWSISTRPTHGSTYSANGQCVVHTASPLGLSR
jgi:hypothetical protein